MIIDDCPEIVYILQNLCVLGLSNIPLFLRDLALK